MPRGGPDANWFDRRMDPGDLEWIDDPDAPMWRKLYAIEGLDNFNRRFGSYRQFTNEALKLLPRGNFQPRIVEFGAGSGELSARLAERLLNSGHAPTVLATDISRQYVGEMRRNLRLRNLGISAKVMDATRTKLKSGSYDLAIFTQALHHLEPRQVVRLLEEGTRVAERFLIIDAWRNPLLLLAAPAFWLLGNFGSFHDGIISLRRMYSARALEYLAAQCSAEIDLDITFLPPGYMRCVARRR
jgi:SAM-dependent methyltransferase